MSLERAKAYLKEYKMEDQADGRSKIRRIVLISSVVIIVSVGVLLYSRRKRKARK